jgi:GDP-L-fucose synthase
MNYTEEIENTCRKKTLLITGAGPTGVTGRAIKEFFDGQYDVLSPSSKELDLTDDLAVKEYFDVHHIDYVVHCATFRKDITKTEHFVDEELESNLRMYFALVSQSAKFKKMVYFGSGAEYDKTREIVNITEECFGERLPKNKYGLGKYIMNQHCRKSDNIYNLRLFGTLNKYERYTKNVVCNLCAKALLGLPLTLKQDCRFSWVDIADVCKAVDYIFKNSFERHDWNIALPQSYSLSEIASMIGQIAGSNNKPVFELTGFNKEYTCETQLFSRDFYFPMTDIHTSLSNIYQYLMSIKETINTDDIDTRWNK